MTCKNIGFDSNRKYLGNNETRAKQVKIKTDFIETVRNFWNVLDQEVIRNCVDSITRIIKCMLLKNYFMVRMNIQFTQCFPGSTPLLTLFRLSTYPMLVNMDGLFSSSLCFHSGISR